MCIVYSKSCCEVKALTSGPAGLCHKLGGIFWGNWKQPQLQLGDSQRIVSMAAVVYCLYTVYDCPHKHGHKGFTYMSVCQC